jgi:hypothetical protein
LTDQQTLDRSSARNTLPKQPSREHFRVVENEQIAWTEIVTETLECRMRCNTVLSRQHEQS